MHWPSAEISLFLSSVVITLRVGAARNSATCVANSGRNVIAVNGMSISFLERENGKSSIITGHDPYKAQQSTRGEFAMRLTVSEKTMIVITATVGYA